MKSTSGKPYIKPSGQPTFRMVSADRSVLIEAFETAMAVEVFQKTKEHEQRTVMKPNDFTNFHSMLINSGFVVQ